MGAVSHKDQGRYANFILKGDEGVGKTTVLQHFMAKSTIHSPEYASLCSLISRQYRASFTFEKGVVKTVSLAESAWMSRYDQGFLLLYAVDAPTHIESLAAEIKFMKANRGDAPIILVGNKSDVAKRAVNFSDVQKLGLSVGVDCFEISAKTGEGTDELLEWLSVQFWYRHEIDKTLKKALKRTSSLDSHKLTSLFSKIPPIGRKFVPYTFYRGTNLIHEACKAKNYEAVKFYISQGQYRDAYIDGISMMEKAKKEGGLLLDALVPGMGILDTGTCDICFEDIALFPLSCSHKSCLDCLSEWFTQLHENSDELVCPSRDCEEPVFDYEIRLILNSRTASEYFHRRFLKYASNDSRLLWCPSCDVGGWVKSRKCQILNCPTCGHNWCRKCFVPHTADTSCKKAKRTHRKDLKLASEWQKLNSKSCPNCKTKIEKNGGCPHMVCTKCIYQFCWDCMVVWDESHFCNGFQAPRPTIPTTTTTTTRTTTTTTTTTTMITTTTTTTTTTMTTATTHLTAEEMGITDSEMERLGKERDKELNEQAKVWQQRLDKLRSSPVVPPLQPSNQVTESEVAAEILAILTCQHETDSQLSEVEEAKSPNTEEG